MIGPNGQRTSWNKRPVAEGMKYCPMCKTEKPLEAFPGKKRRDGYCTPCKAKRGTMLQSSPTIEARFWPKVERRGPDECWLWTGAVNTRGYGQLWIGGKERLILAHRLSLILHGHEVPPPGRDIKNGVIDHKCKVHACVNPAHLRVVTQRVNTVENGESPFAINARKTHCVRGHEFTPENTKRTEAGYRECRACRRERYAESKNK